MCNLFFPSQVVISIQYFRDYLITYDPFQSANLVKSVDFFQRFLKLECVRRMRRINYALYETALNENVCNRRMCSIKISSLGEGTEVSVFGSTRTPNALNENKRMRRMRGLKLSVIGEYSEGYKFASLSANIWRKEI
jgi:hypothetical protein